MTKREQYIDAFNKHEWNIGHDIIKGYDVYTIVSPKVFQSKQFGIEEYSWQFKQSVAMKEAEVSDEEFKESLLSSIRPIADKWEETVELAYQSKDKSEWPDYISQNCRQMINAGKLWLLNKGNAVRGECERIDKGEYEERGIETKKEEVEMEI